jgi:CDP-diacylglycerol--serine O-phosphatidyltransferase
MRIDLRHRRDGIESPSLIRQLPNMMTTLALAAGMNAMRFAIQGRWKAAVVAIGIAAVLDTLDGRTARLLNAQSKFGAELDSLSDVVCFGVAPALTLYLWSLHSAGNFGWLAALAFGICAALRLARFNAALTAIGPRQPKAPYFVGVPTPAGAGIALLPLIGDFELGEPDLMGHPFFVSLWMLMTALLMVSRIPTPAFAGIRVPQWQRLPLLAAIGIAAGATVDVPWATAIVLVLGYLASIPWLYWRKRRRGRGARVRETGTPAAMPEGSTVVGMRRKD